MKTCSKCGVTKDLAQFSKHTKSKDGLKNHCKDCDRIYNQVCDKAARNERKLLSQKKRRELRWLKILDFLKGKSCSNCTETDPVVMEFDHIDSLSKEKCISEMVNQCYSWERIEAEINKCQILCANCHRRKTARELGWYRNRD